MNHRDRHPEEQRYWRDRPSWEDEYGFGQRTPSREQYRPERQRARYREEGGWENRFPRDQQGREHSSEQLFDREPFGRGEEPRYYGTGAAGWGGPGFTGGGYGWGEGSRSPHLPLEGEYSDESALSYEDQVRRDYRASGRSGVSRGSRRYPPGPKGYQRSDERMKEDISERLYRAYHIDSSDVTVEVRTGKVTLEGTVPSRHMKHAIEDMVDDCPGVMEIDNRIRVAGLNYQGSSPAGASSSAASATSPTMKSSMKQ
ncbi:MAG TPA: BON domain-containing protein [Steroidobacteraceae bacterium]